MTRHPGRLYLDIQRCSNERLLREPTEAVRWPPAEAPQEIQQRERQINESDIWNDSHTPPNSATSPPTNVMGIPDDKGYEWTKSEDGSDWYRILGSNSEWQRFEA